MANEDKMLPGSSPGSVGVGTRRVNRNPIYIMIAIVLAFLLVMVLAQNLFTHGYALGKL